MALNGISKVLNLVETVWLRLSTDMIKSLGLRITSRKPTASIYKINQLYRSIRACEIDPQRGNLQYFKLRTEVIHWYVQGAITPWHVRDEKVSVCNDSQCIGNDSERSLFCSLAMLHQAQVGDKN